LGKFVVATTGAPTLAIEILSPCDAELELASVTVIVNEEEPTEVGTPVITPDEVFSDSPGGNEPAERANEYGVFPPVTDKT
jgi:hypothetical protein